MGGGSGSGGAGLSTERLLGAFIDASVTVPVERVVANVEAWIKDKPQDAQAYYVLGTIREQRRIQVIWNAHEKRCPCLPVVAAAGLLLTALAATVRPGPSSARGADPAPATVPAGVLDAIVKDLTSDDFQVRNTAQKKLDQVPAAQYAELIARAEATVDPEAKARLLARVEKLALELEAAGGEAGAAIKVARLLAMPASGEDPRGTMNSKRLQLIRDIGSLGDVAVKPLQAALARAQTPLQRREVTSALGAIQTAGSTRVLLGLLAEKDDVIRHQAIQSLADRLGAAPEEGRSDDILPALARTLPGEKDESVRWQVCAGITRVRMVNKPDARLVAQVTEMLRERLKNDGSPKVRMWAAITMSELGDDSGSAELAKAVLAMQSGDGAAAYENSELLGFPLHRLIPALGRGTGQDFGPVPMDPSLSSDSTAGPRLQAQRQALLDKVAQWIKANPAATAPEDAARRPAATEPGRTR
jgi:HEAT repeat protein